MIEVDIISHFPQMHIEYLKYSFFNKLIKDKKLNIFTHSITQISQQHKINNDGKPFGHNKGMLLNCNILDIILPSIDKYNSKSTIIIHPSPSGYKLDNEIVSQMHIFQKFIFVCSRYEGLDKRAINHFNIFEICIGDYILFDGDTAAMVIYNSIIRDKYVKKTAKINESFDNYLLEHDQFTHPKIYKNLIVDNILCNGNHKEINLWQKHNSIKKTIKTRLDLYDKYIKHE